MNKKQRTVFITIIALMVVVLLTILIILLTRKTPVEPVEPYTPIATEAPVDTTNPLGHLSEDEIGRLAMEEESETDFSRAFEDDDTPESLPEGPID